MTKEKKEYVCKICGEKCYYFGNYGFLIHHVKREHNVDQKEYYDKYVKSNNEGICKVCGEPTKFVKFSKGYRDFCGPRCANKSKEVRRKIEQTNLERYGTKHSGLAPEVKKKREETCRKKYGNDNYFGSKAGIEMLYETWKNKTDGEKEEIKRKRSETNIEKYDAENPFASEQIKEKIQKYWLENYGVTNGMQVEEIAKKLSETILSKSQEWKDKKYEKVTINNMKRCLDRLKEKLPENYKVLSYNRNEVLKAICDKGHEFEIYRQLVKVRHKKGVPICTVCNPLTNMNQSQSVLFDFVKEFYNGTIINNHRKTLWPYEMDLYLPDLKMAIEFNGLYFHNELTKDKNYHLTKTKLAEEKGIHLIHIYEDDWVFKQDIVKSRIKNLLGETENRIYARNCEIRTVEYGQAKEFLDQNHIQGNCVSSIRLGLYHNDILVSLMTFGGGRVNLGKSKVDGEYELLRFCNSLDTNVLGAASKLFKYFVQNYNPFNVYSYADRSWTCGFKQNVYEKLGFIKEKATNPNYYYIVNNKRENRFKYMKSELVKQGFDETKTEHDIMLDREIYRIYDSGSFKYVYTR